MKVIYTEAAEQELQTFHERQRRLLEQLVADKKVVFGDDTLEITASDIKEMSDRIQAFTPRRARYESVRLIAQIYTALGVLIMIGAFLYPQLHQMFTENPLQGMIFLAGATTLLMGIASFIIIAYGCDITIRWNTNLIA